MDGDLLLDDAHIERGRVGESWLQTTAKMVFV